MDTGDSGGPRDPLVRFYVEALGRLTTGGIPFLVGGSFAFARHTGIHRDTKDLDVFLMPADVDRTLALFERAGYRADVPFPHWLGKVFHGGFFLDLIFCAGNGVARVDQGWFDHAVDDDVLGMPVRLCPPEEMIWSKAFVQERERFDGADVIHLLREAGPTLDWPRLLARFGDHWPVLLSHLILFRFVYPDRRHVIPSRVVNDLMARAAKQRSEPDNHVCHGTLLSREQYLHDLEQFGYGDARLEPHGAMTREEMEIWTEAIEDKD
jgi:hypothetical protein